MKNYIILIVLLSSAIISSAQERVPVANFSQFQHYFNPALVGNEGTALKSFYRNQFEGSDDAPKTLFVSGEVNLSDMMKVKSKSLLSHAFGLSYLNDSYGSLSANKFTLAYNAGYPLTKNVRIHAGAAVAYNNSKFNFDNDGLVFDEDENVNLNDDINKVGVNAGLAITSDHFYVGYALTNLVEETISDQTYFEDLYAIQHIVQAGYRRTLAQQFGVIVNGIFRYDEAQKETLEGQLKGVYKNTVWLGAGYRNDLAYTINAGVQFNQFKLGYAREINSNNVNSLYKGDNEITLSYNFTPKLAGKKLSIW